MAPQPKEIAAGVYWLPTRGANVYLLRSQSSWALIDTGFPNRARLIHETAVAVFGSARPAAILLTHFHEDHAGSALELSRKWSVPIYVHRDELPFVTGTPALLFELARKPYPPVGGCMRPIGILLMLAQNPHLVRFFSRITEWYASKFNLGDAVRGYLPGDGVPSLLDWECIPTPGHTPGHVAFFRRSDRVLIAGDACLTVDIDSFWGLLSQRQCIARPPSVATWNWHAAKASVAALAKLEPRVLASGHGIPMTGAGTARDLQAFSERFAG